MMSTHRASAEGLELAPPDKLLALRDALVGRPSPSTRSAHLAAVATALAERPSAPVRRWASRGAKGAAAVVAALSITSGLAAAEALPAPAQRIFSSVSSHFSPPKATPVPATPAAVEGSSNGSSPDGNGDNAGPAAVVADETATTVAVAAPSTTAPASTTVPPVTTTVPGLAGPGSGEGPTDPTIPEGPTEPGSGPTEPGPGPTDPEPADGTVSATDVSTTTTPESTPTSGPTESAPTLSNSGGQG